MRQLDESPEVLHLAQQLGLGGSEPTRSILAFCRRRVDSFVAEAGGVTDVAAFEAAVLKQLQMVVEEIRCDEDFARISERYTRQKGEKVFSGVRFIFDNVDRPVYGALLERRNAMLSDVDRFVALVDCRGNKAPRSFFTRWHEIAHRLTTHADCSACHDVSYRSEDDPLEQLMDKIAAHIGFYEPILVPAYEAAMRGQKMLTFEIVGAVIAQAFPTASFQSTLFACTKRVQTPLIYLEAAIGHKKQVARRLSADGAGVPGRFPGELRAVKVFPNAAAVRSRFVIHQNMRVPKCSIIRRLFDSELQMDTSSLENLDRWESGDKRLGSCRMRVEARRVPERVIAVLQPVL